jgi:hypothetical protein
MGAIDTADVMLLTIVRLSTWCAAVFRSTGGLAYVYCSPPPSEAEGLKRRMRAQPVSRRTAVPRSVAGRSMVEPLWSSSFMSA